MDNWHNDTGRRGVYRQIMNDPLIQEIRAGISAFKPADYFKVLNRIRKECDLSGLEPLRIAVLRSYTLEMLEPVLSLRLILEGFHPTIYWGTYNQYPQEILDTESRLYAFKPDLALLMVRVEERMPSFIEDFDRRTGPDWKTHMMEEATAYAALADTLSEHASAYVICQTLAMESPPFRGLYDAQTPDGQGDLLALFNTTVAEQCLNMSQVFFWDYQSFLNRNGTEFLLDPKAWYSSRNPFKQTAFIPMANDLLASILSIQGKTKKCIVTDLDNTLWGGTAGEEGVAGVKLGHAYPGNCYLDVQKVLYSMYHRGILLAINSKNNESDAFDIIDNHPEMVLRRQHFAAHRINWDDKASNIRSIADELNIGVDSMVFIDDNLAEIGLVRHLCPECEVLALPSAPYLMPSAIRQLAGLDNIRLTAEDRTKGQMYQAQRDRIRLEEQSKDLGSFLHSLEMEMAVKQADPYSIPRIAQLTQKTNQLI